MQILHIFLKQWPLCVCRGWEWGWRNSSSLYFFFHRFLNVFDLCFTLILLAARDFNDKKVHDSHNNGVVTDQIDHIEGG
jgi:hypothetical protein